MDLSRLAHRAPPAGFSHRPLKAEHPVWVNVKIRVPIADDRPRPLGGILELESVTYYSHERRTERAAVLGFVDVSLAYERRKQLRDSLGIGDILVPHQQSLADWGDRCDRLGMPLVVVLRGTEDDIEVHVRWNREGPPSAHAPPLPALL
jgi:hypothetical protein